MVNEGTALNCEKYFIGGNKLDVYNIGDGKCENWKAEIETISEIDSLKYREDAFAKKNLKSPSESLMHIKKLILLRNYLMFLVFRRLPKSEKSI